MKKIFGLIIIVVMFLTLTGGVFAADIAYIVKSSNRVNSNVVSAINDLGYNYSVISESQIASTNFSQYRLIFVGDDPFNNPALIPVSQHNSFIMNHYHYYQKGSGTNIDWQWGWSKDQTTISRSIMILNNNQNTVIAQNLPDQFTAYNAGGINAYELGGMKPVNLTYVTYSGTPASGNFVVAFVNSGTRMLNGETTKGRSLFFGLTGSDYWTADTKNLFKSSLSWAIKGQDKDMDGFFDNDCNDNNAGINPNATEIAYNHVDENCDSIDLADVDSDGYCKAGYLIGNKALQCPLEQTNIGSDCSDNNSSINVGSTDLLNNCINDAPIQIFPINNIQWDEDSFTELNINEIKTHFNDAETASENLIVTIKDISTSNIISIFNSTSGIFKFTNLGNWNGEANITFSVSDGENLVDSNPVYISVIPVNDNPVLNNLEDEYVLAGKTIIITPNATDIDGDNLIFSFSSPLDVFGKWITTQNDVGIYSVNVIASDGGGEDIKNFNLIVMAKSVINEFYSNNDNDWVELYNPGTTIVNLNGCYLNNSLNNKFDFDGTINPQSFRVFNIDNFINENGTIELGCNNELIDRVSYGGNGVADIPGIIEGKSVGRVSDGLNTGNGADFKLYDYPTKNLSNSADMIAPIINLINQNNLTLNNRNVNLAFNVSDNSQNISCDLYSDSNNGIFSIVNSLSGMLENGIFNGNFSLNNLADGDYKWNVKCSDGTYYVFAPENKTFSISAPDNPTLNNIGNQIISENQTLEFSVIGSDNDLNDSLSYYVDNLPNGAVFNNNLFSWAPGFNQSGTYNVRFSVKDSTNLTSYQDVNIRVIDVILPPEFNGIETSGKCSVKDSRIVLNIKDPGNSALNIGDEFEVRVNVKNNLPDDAKFNVKGYLYDLDINKSIEDNSVKISVDKGKGGDAIFNMIVPKDVDESHDFALYVYADGDNACNTAYKDVTIERQENSLQIIKFDLTPSEQNPGSEITLKVKVQNLGSEDQDDAYITIQNSQIGINIKSDTFSIEPYGEDDTLSKSFSFTIPENLSNGEYNLVAKVYYNGDSNEKGKKITISSSIQNDNLGTGSNTNTITNSGSGNSNTITYAVGSNSATSETTSANGNTITYAVPTDSVNVIGGDTKTYFASDTAIGDSEPTVVSIDSIRLDNGKVLSVYEEDVPQNSVNNSDLIQKASVYAKDPTTKSLLYVLNVLFAIGIVTFIICIGYIIRLRY